MGIIFWNIVKVANVILKKMGNSYYKDINYNISEMGKCIVCTFKVGLLSCIIAIPTRIFLNNSIIECILLFMITIVAVMISSYIFMYKEDRQKATSFIYNKIKQRR